MKCNCRNRKLPEKKEKNIMPNYLIVLISWMDSEGTPIFEVSQSGSVNFCHTYATFILSTFQRLSFDFKVLVH